MNSLDRLILDFISSQRHEIEPVISYYSDKELMNKFGDILGAAMFRNAPSIRIYISCSYQKYSCIFPAKNGDRTVYYMLYDKHLIECLSILNSIFLCENDAEADLWKFSYQIFSEETYIVGEKIASLYTAMNFNALEEYGCAQEFYSPNNTKWIDVQTDYILAHELGHWLYDLEEYKEDRDHALKNIQEILDDAYTNLLHICSDNDYVNLISESLEKMKSNGALIEECFCDAVAFSYIFSKAEEIGCSAEDKLETMKALFICLLHTQILSMCNYTVSEHNNYEIANSVRFVFVRNYISCFFEEHEKAMINDCLTNCGEIYERKITSIILQVFTAIENRIGNLYENMDAMDSTSILRDILSD